MTLLSCLTCGFCGAPDKATQQQLQLANQTYWQKGNLKFCLVNPGTGQRLNVTVTMTGQSGDGLIIINNAEDSNETMETKIKISDIQKVFRGKRIDVDRILDSPHVGDNCVTIIFEEIALTFIFDFDDNICKSRTKYQSLFQDSIEARVNGCRRR